MRVFRSRLSHFSLFGAVRARMLRADGSARPSGPRAGRGFHGGLPRAGRCRDISFFERVADPEPAHPRQGAAVWPEDGARRHGDVGVAGGRGTRPAAAAVVARDDPAGRHARGLPLSASADGVLHPRFNRVSGTAGLPRGGRAAEAGPPRAASVPGAAGPSRDPGHRRAARGGAVRGGDGRRPPRAGGVPPLAGHG